MICFLTSRMDNPFTGELNTANGFADEVRKHFPDPCRALYICSDPDGWEKTDFYAYSTPDNARKIRTGFDLSERNAHMKEGRDFWGINGELKVLSTDDDVICVEFVPLERENGELTKKNVQDIF